MVTWHCSVSSTLLCVGQPVYGRERSPRGTSFEENPLPSSVLLSLSAHLIPETYRLEPKPEVNYTLPPVDFENLIQVPRNYTTPPFTSTDTTEALHYSLRTGLHTAAPVSPPLSIPSLSPPVPQVRNSGRTTTLPPPTLLRCDRTR